MRGFMLDSARALDGRSYYKRFIDFAADRGMDTILWHFTDDQGCAMRFETVDVPASPNAYSKAESRELAAYAKSRGILLIPELAGLGHTRYITHTGTQYRDLAESDDWFSAMCPVSERTREVIARLLDEVVETFDSPIIHVGLDEVNYGAHPLTQAALQTRSAGQIFADYLDFLHKHLSAHGRRMMMWGDYLLKLPDALERAPRDILIANWEYQPNVTRDQTDRLIAAGFEYVSCPALISHNQPIVPGESFAYPNVRKMTEYAQNPKCAGVLTTIWTPTRFMSDTLWPAVDYAAAVMREGADVPVAAQATRFAREYFGIEEHAEQLGEVLKQLSDWTPMRRNWTPFLTCEPEKFPNSSILDEFVAKGKFFQKSLEGLAAGIRREQDSYARLQLLADLITHVSERAILVRDGGAINREILEKSAEIGDRISHAWDTERFADDPRKWHPATDYDAGDSLVQMYAKGTAVIQRAVADGIVSSEHTTLHATTNS